MCLMCVLKEASVQKENVRISAEDAARKIAESLFGKEAVEEALADQSEPTEEESQAAEFLADAIFGSMFGADALASVKQAQQKTKEEEEAKGVNPLEIFFEIQRDLGDETTAVQAEAFADRIYVSLYGEEELAKTKASAEVQAFLASKRAGSNQASKRTEPTIGSVGGDPKTAPEFLQRAQQHMDDRAVTYDNAQGERSMEKTVEIFNTLRNQQLTEADGWTFMAILKMVRANQGQFKSDNYEDLVAYTALLGEAEAKAQAA